MNPATSPVRSRRNRWGLVEDVLLVVGIDRHGLDFDAISADAAVPLDQSADVLRRRADALMAQTSSLSIEMHGEAIRDAALARMQAAKPLHPVFPARSAALPPTLQPPQTEAPVPYNAHGAAQRQAPPMPHLGLPVDAPRPPAPAPSVPFVLPLSSAAAIPPLPMSVVVSNAASAAPAPVHGGSGSSSAGRVMRRRADGGVASAAGLSTTGRAPSSDLAVTPHATRTSVATRPQDTDCSRRRFTLLEEYLLLCGVEKLRKAGGRRARMQWAQILRDPDFGFHPKRTSVDLKDKFRNLSKQGVTAPSQLVERAHADGIDLPSLALESAGRYNPDAISPPYRRGRKSARGTGRVRRGNPAATLSGEPPMGGTAPPVLGAHTMADATPVVPALAFAGTSFTSSPAAGTAVPRLNVPALGQGPPTLSVGAAVGTGASGTAISHTGHAPPPPPPPQTATTTTTFQAPMAMGVPMGHVAMGHVSAGQGFMGARPMSSPAALTMSMGRVAFAGGAQDGFVVPFFNGSQRGGMQHWPPYSAPPGQ